MGHVITSKQTNNLTMNITNLPNATDMLDKSITDTITALGVLSETEVNDIRNWWESKTANERIQIKDKHFPFLKCTINVKPYMLKELYDEQNVQYKTNFK